jgi:drug/metabolite transporter (DMT)-like permease
MQSGSWQVFILLHALFSALQVLQFRAIARDKKARHAGLAVNAISFSTLYVCGLVVLPIIGGVAVAEFLDIWLLFVTSASLFVFSLYLMYKAFTHLESATASVLGTSSALFTVIIAGVFYGERLSPTQLFGIAIVVPAIYYVLLLARRSHRLIDLKDTNWLHGFWYMIAGSFCLSLAHIFEKDILQQASVGTYIAFGWLLQVAAAWALYLLFGRHAHHVFKQEKTVRSSMQLGAMRAATGFFFILALKISNNVSLVTVVANFRIILVALLAGWFLQERRYYYRKIAAAAVSVVGLSIIFWN